MADWHLKQLSKTGPYIHVQYMCAYVTERVVIAVKLLSRIWEVLASNLGRDTVYPCTIRGQSLQANARVVHRLSHDRFLLIPLQIIIQL